MYRKRIKILILVFCGSLAVIIARLAYLQFIQADAYREQARKALQFVRWLPTMRGRILDRRGRVLAYDKPCFDFCLDYRFLTQNRHWVARQKRQIASKRGVDADQAEKIFDRRVANTWRLAAQVTGRSREELEDTVIQRIKRRVPTFENRRKFGISLKR